jgi:hypothetical protein
MTRRERKACQQSGRGHGFGKIPAAAIYHESSSILQFDRQDKIAMGAILNRPEAIKNSIPCPARFDWSSVEVSLGSLFVGYRDDPRAGSRTDEFVRLGPLGFEPRTKGL